MKPLPSSFYQLICLTLLLVVFSSPALADSGPADPAIETTPTGLPVYRLIMDPADWDTLTTTPVNSEQDLLGNTEFNLTFVSGQVSLPATIRLRGASTRWMDWYPKRSFKIKFAKGLDFLGRTELNLLAAQYDPTFLLEKFAYDTMAQTGALASRAQHAELHVNDSYYGLMLDVESVSSKRFLTAHGLEQAATIYRTNWYFMFREEPAVPAYAGYDYQLTKKTNEADPSLQEAIDFIEGLNRTPDDQFATWLSAHMDVEAYLSFMVADALISNDVTGHSRSFLIHEPEVNHWWWAPWDLNNSLVIWGNITNWENSNEWVADVSQPAPVNHTPVPHTVYEYAYRPLSWEDPDVGADWSVLKTRVLDNPQFRARFIARLQEALNTTFTEEALFPSIDEQYAQIEPSVWADPFVKPEAFPTGPNWLKQYVSERRAYLLSQLRAIQAIGQTDLTLSEVGEGYIELYNATSADYDVSGYYLTNNLHQPTQFTLPAGSIVPAGGYLLVYDVAVKTSGGQIGLFKPATVEEASAGDHGVMDLVYYGSFAPGSSYARTPVGSETWAVQAEATPGY